MARAARTAVIAALMLAQPAGAQILNTLRAFGSGEPGWSGEIGAFVSATGGNTENVSLSGSARVQRQGATHRWRLLGDAARSTVRGATTEEATVLHLRHNARLTGRLFSIGFVQHQHDRFQRLTARYLVGAGLRWDWLRRDALRGSWGVTPMLESERVEGESTRTHGRLSTFVSVLGRLSERAEVDVTTFVQPRMDDTGDVRAMVSSSLSVAVSGRLSLVAQVSLVHDAEPPQGVEETDWKTRTGLSVQL